MNSFTMTTAVAPATTPLPVAACEGIPAISTSNCPSAWPVITVPQNTAMSVTVQIQDNNGNFITTSVEDDLGVPGDVILSPAYLYLKQHGMDTQIVAVNGNYYGGGKFIFNFTVENTKFAGMFLADIFIFDDQGEIKYVKNGYAVVEFNNTDNISRQPISIAEVRLAIRDNCPDNNYLLDDYEFKDNEIWYCIRKPVDLWNETDPVINQYTYSSFPYRHNWLECAVGFLLKMAAHRYRRNDLQYQAAGLAIADQAKYEQYDRAGSERIEMFMAWMRTKKISDNVDGAFSGIVGRWSY